MKNLIQIFSGELKYHKLLKTYFAARNSLEISEIEDRILELNNQFSKDSLALVNSKDLYKIQLDIISTETKLSEISKQGLKIDSLLQVEGISPKIKDSLQATRGFLLFEYKNHSLNMKSWQIQLDKIKRNEDFFDEEFEKKSTNQR